MGDGFRLPRRAQKLADTFRLVPAPHRHARAGARRLSRLGRARFPMVQDFAADGSLLNLKIKGKRGSLDVYHSLLGMRWSALVLAVALLYFGLAGLFALLFYLDPSGDAVGLANPDDYGDYFAFSIQTLSTIGYGTMFPQTTWAHVFVSLEPLCGLMLTAVVTGITFSKLSHPRAGVRFSSVICFRDIDGEPHMAIRIANERRTQILNVHTHVAVLMQRMSAEGQPIYVYRPLRTDTERLPIFIAGARIKHKVDDSSPIHGMKSLADAEALGILSFQVLLEGTEEVYGRRIFAKHAYRLSDIRFGHSFAQMLYKDQSGITFNLDDLDNISEIKPADVKRAALHDGGNHNAMQRRPSFFDSRDDHFIPPARSCASPRSSSAAAVSSSASHTLASRDAASVARENNQGHDDRGSSKGNETLQGFSFKAVASYLSTPLTGSGPPAPTVAV